MRSRVRKGHLQQLFITKGEDTISALRRDPESRQEFRSDRACEQRRDRIANLTKAVPVSCVKAKPVRIGVEPGCLTHRDAPRRVGMNRPGRRERPSIAGRAGTKRWGQSARIETGETADGVARTRGHRGEALALAGTMTRSAGASEQVAVEGPSIGEVVGDPDQTPQAARIERVRCEGGPNRVAMKQIRNRIDFRQITDRVLNADVVCLQRRIAGKSAVGARANEENAGAILRDASVSRVQGAPRRHDTIPAGVEIAHHRLKHLVASAAQHAGDVLESEIGGTEFADQSNEMTRECVARIIGGALAHHREPLTGRTAEDSSNVRGSNAGEPAQSGTVKGRDIAADRPAERKVERVRSAMDWVDIDRSNDVESGEFETEAHAAGSRKQVHSDRSHKGS